MVERCLAGINSLVCILVIDSRSIFRCLFVCCEESVCSIAPDVTENLSYIVVRKKLGRVVELCDDSLEVTKRSRDTIVERLSCKLEVISP